MSLARAWSRQLYGASSAALIVPFAMLAALLVLALGGGFGQVGVLGQIFAGPPAPEVGGAASPGAGLVARSLPVIPAAAVRTRPARARNGSVGTAPGPGRGRMIPLSSPGIGGAVAPVGGIAPVVSGPTYTPVAPRPAPTGSGSAPSQPSPQPAPPPKPQPTPVDQIVSALTPVTQQLPAPAGPAVTQVVQTAGSAADGLKLP